MQAELEGSRHCEERSDEAIQRSVGRPATPGLLRFARNDGSGLRLAGALCLTNSAARGALANTVLVTVVDRASLNASKSIRVGSNRWSAAIETP